MEDVVGIIVTDKEGESTGFLTYGRLWSPVDAEELLAAVAKGVSKFGIDSGSSIRLCSSLTELAVAPYFYECILALAWRPIPFGDGYDAWRTSTRSRIQTGEELYCVGSLV